MSDNSVKVWMAQIRAPFLILAVFLVVIGLAFSVKYPQTDGQSFSCLMNIPTLRQGSILTPTGHPLAGEAG